MNQVLIAIDQLINTLFGGWADETLSARAYRLDWWGVKLINLIFLDSNHCIDAYLSEKERAQLPPAYR